MMTQAIAVAPSDTAAAIHAARDVFVALNGAKPGSLRFHVRTDGLLMTVVITLVADVRNCSICSPEIVTRADWRAATVHSALPRCIWQGARVRCGGRGGAVHTIAVACETVAQERLRLEAEKHTLDIELMRKMLEVGCCVWCACADACPSSSVSAQRWTWSDGSLTRRASSSSSTACWSRSPPRRVPAHQLWLVSHGPGGGGAAAALERADCRCQ